MEFKEIKITSPDGVTRTELQPFGDTEALAKRAQVRDHEVAKALARGAGAEEIKAIMDKKLSENPIGKIVPFPSADSDQSGSTG